MIFLMTSLSKTVSRLVPAGAWEGGAAARLTIAAWLTQIIHGGMNPKSSKRAGLRRLPTPDSIVYAANQQIRLGCRISRPRNTNRNAVGFARIHLRSVDVYGPRFGVEPRKAVGIHARR